jgi:hypothetical protein
MTRGKKTFRGRMQFVARHRLVRSTQRALEQGGYPRLQMALIVALTGLVGLLASWLLLQSGLTRMGLRYPLSLGVAYLAFLALLWAWLRTRPSEWLDLADPDLIDLSGRALARIGDAASSTGFGGGGGGFGGGGASGSFDVPVSPFPESDRAGDGIADVLDGADEGAIPIAVLLLGVALICGLVAAASYVVWAAPVLMAELMVDGLLSYGLYARLRNTDPQPWLWTAVRATWWNVLLVAVFLVVAGELIAWKVPGADSIGDLFRPAATATD